MKIFLLPPTQGVIPEEGGYLKKIMFHINTMLCLLKVDSNTIELKVHTSCYSI